ncbi:Putative vacuolar membrane transporter for cationic amino acids [Rhodosporidiobolus nylandii]
MARTLPTTRTLALSAVAAVLVFALVAPASPSPSPTLASLPPPGPPDEPVRLHDGHPRLSSAVGWASIASWILILLCYKEQSGESLSLLFLFIWLTGDITNLFGSVWQGLIPTVIILALYYTLCDVILIFQRRLHPEVYAPSSAAEPSSLEPTTPISEQTPLLSSFSAHAPSQPALSPALQRAKDILSYAGGFILVLLVGVIAWFASKDAGKDGRREEVWDTSAQVVGWVSAFLYLGSRLPQLALNRKTKCAGLSLLMFAFAVCGNATYVASILLTSTSYQHLLINAPWLVGSGGTIFLDFLVLSQFVYYRRERLAEQQAKVFANDEGQVGGDAEE